MSGEDSSRVFSGPFPTSRTVCDARVEEKVKRTLKAYYKHKDYGFVTDIGFVTDSRMSLHMLVLTNLIRVSFTY